MKIFSSHGQVLMYDVTSQNNTISSSVHNTSIIDVKGYNVAGYGLDGNNDFPVEIQNTVKDNHILPELIEKQIKYLYGDGAYLYKDIIEQNGNKKIKVRQPVEDKKIQSWLESWEEFGVPGYDDYLQKVIREFYYTEGIFTKFIFTKGNRIGKSNVAYLEYIYSKYARFATKSLKYKRQRTAIENKDFKFILYGNWSSNDNKKVYKRLNKKNLDKMKVAINYSLNDSFGEELYSFPAYYLGLREWIKGSNLNPKYINSYLKNALNARIHVSIPSTWVEMQKNRLNDIIDENKERFAQSLDIVDEYHGVTVGLEYRESMLDELITKKLEQITELLAGEGENQGKIFTSIKLMSDLGVEDWEFKEIPSKYKEFIDSIIKYDERAVEVILEGKGLDASISNVAQKGVISKSGADAYYNYMIYLNSLMIPEKVCTADINYAIKLNFPGTDVKLGFYRSIPARQSEITPSERISQNL